MICFICHEVPDVEHEHHPILQSAGGKNEGTITLCSNCHNSVHSEINRLCALYRKGKGGATSVYWKMCRHPQEVDLATRVVLTGVKSVLTQEVRGDTKSSITLDPETHRLVMAIKQRTGARNMQTTIIECIRFTARQLNLV